MSEPVVVIEVQRLVETRTFMEGARAHVDGLAGYVRDFLAENGGLYNENGRAWSVESCADALKIPGKTLRRWMGELEAPDQAEPAAHALDPREVRSARSAIARAPDDVVASLQPGQLDALHAAVVDRRAAEMGDVQPISPKTKINGSTEKQAMRGLQTAAVAFQSLAEGLDAGWYGDWSRLYGSEDAQPLFQILRDGLPTVTRRLKTVIRETGATTERRPKCSDCEVHCPRGYYSRKENQ